MISTVIPFKETGDLPFPFSYLGATTSTGHVTKQILFVKCGPIFGIASGGELSKAKVICGIVINNIAIIFETRQWEIFRTIALP
jgi:hypothetical protein